MANDLHDTEVFFPSLTQLRAFYEAARLGSISRASEGLLRSQSAVTQAVQSLEAELEVTLFDRTRTGSYVTEMGRILQNRAGRCFSKMEVAIDAVQDSGADNSKANLASRRLTRAQILALIAVHEYGSFAQAARHMPVSLASLQRSARNLEKQLGRKLFAHTAHGISTNPVGARLSNELQLAIRELEWAQEEMRSYQGLLRGRLLVGSLLLAGNNYISVELGKFAELHPQVNIRLINAPYDELLSKLRGGSIDFLVGLLKSPPPTDDVVEEPLMFDSYTVAAARTHPLVGRNDVTLEAFRNYEWVAPGVGAQRRKVFESIFGDGPLPHFSVETHSLLTIFILLSQSKRIAVMTHSELSVDKKLGHNLAAIDYPIEAPPATIGVTTRINWEATRLQRAFLDFLREGPHQID
jgi:LysR family transcriptional regulator, regulator for genes of the gallate degradation pathway